MAMTVLWYCPGLTDESVRIHCSLSASLRSPRPSTISLLNHAGDRKDQDSEAKSESAIQQETHILSDVKRTISMRL
jgi:hypothetical protein